MRCLKFKSGPLAAVLLAVCLLQACAHEPAFREELPASLALDGRSIAIIGDLQQSSFLPRLFRHRENNREPQQRLIADLRSHMDELGAVVVVGDLVFNARTGSDWRHFDSLMAPFAERMPVLPAIGNHDYPCYFIELCRKTVIARGMRERFPWFAPGTPYAVESGDLLLLFLDSDTGLPGEADWLERQLERGEADFAAVLVFFHHPPYTNSIDRGAVGNVEVQEYVVPYLKAADVPVVVFNGHVHGLEYIVRDGVHYVTTAGGGGPRGPMGESRPFDEYRGEDCPQPKTGEVFRPFNYVLLTEHADRLSIEFHGFCRNDPGVSVLDSVDISL